MRNQAFGFVGFDAARLEFGAGLIGVFSPQQRLALGNTVG